MRIVIGGSSGLVGSALVPALRSAGHTVQRLLRRPPDPGSDDIEWDPSAGRLRPTDLDGADAVVHLGGMGVAEARWTAAVKKVIRDSRVQSTRLLSETLAGIENPPGVLVCASAIGYYGDRGDEVLSEESTSGSGFLPEVSREWEDAARVCRDRGLRVVHLRLGMVLSPTGGALQSLLRPFRMGAGGRLGSGRQYVSWIAIDDVVGICQEAISNENLRGAVNAVTPRPVTNSEFTATLARVLGRPAVVPLPAFAARVLFGEMANELLLASTRVEPRRLLDAGFTFRYPELESALRHLLTTSNPK